MAFCRSLGGCLLILVSISAAFGEDLSQQPILSAFASPPPDCRPHTRWWWMGNALRPEDIAGQLEQMHAQGIGGVEQVTMEPVYTKGNHDYLSPAYFRLLRYAVEQARKHNMEFSINFGGPGWIWGGDWVPKKDQSKVLLASMVRLTGPKTFSGALPEEAALNPNDIPRSMTFIAKEDYLAKVVAARVVNGRLQADSLRDLSAQAHNRRIAWEVPEGEWQLMAFWFTQRDNANAVDHLNQEAMARYCETLGNRYVDALGDPLGKTVESFFGDSFEVPIYRNGLYWSDGLFEAFETKTGYDLVPWLPALWWEVDNLSSKVRYDVNAFLHDQGMEAFFKTFLDWCERHGVRGRIQPYGFVTDIIEGAGAASIPEMEITSGEKDAVPWLDTRIGPKQYVASGAHLYGRNLVTAEAFTYLHWEPYRETLEELKIATDGYLYAGANKLYNHGFIASPERDIVPTRGFFAAIRISPENIWWPYYHYLAEYTARCCWLLRQGKPVAEVAVYSPLANQWTQSVLNARKWTREFEWGGLGQLLMSNGYGFDLINDDVLQNHAAFNRAQLSLGSMTYRALILPDVMALPLESFRQIEAYVHQGGSVIALERIPEASTGMRDHAQKDAEIRRIAAELFRPPAGPNDIAENGCGQGRTFCLESVLHRDDPLDERSAPLDPFLKTLRRCVAPAMDIDLVRAGQRNNQALLCTHRRTESMDIFFLSNFQNAPIDEIVGFRVNQGLPYGWNPQTGERRPVCAYSREDGYTRMNVSMEPYESRFIVFENIGSPQDRPHMVQSRFTEILDTGQEGFSALAAQNGPYAYQFYDGANHRTGEQIIEGLPAPYEIDGLWKVQFPEEGGGEKIFQWPGLKSWTDEAQLRHFSGRARYSMQFDLPSAYCAVDTRLWLSLGVVGNVADIQLNGQPLGVHWMAGQRFSLEHIARPGRNTLEIEVTNTLINRVSGLDAFPEVPEDLQRFYGKGVQTTNPEAGRLLGFEPLPRSGLLGPVRILPFRQVQVNWNSGPSR